MSERHVTTRQYYKAAALQGILSAHPRNLSFRDDEPEDIVKQAAYLADLMRAEDKRKEARHD